MNVPLQFTLPPPSDSLILVVDDVQQNIQVVGAMLREAGYSIMPATSGAAALQRVQKKLHDLRSPLGTIKGFAEVLLEDGQMPRDEFEDFTRRIRDTAQRMAEMVQNLLDANRIERDEMEVSLAPCELSEILRSVVRAYQPRATAKRPAVHVEER